MGEKFRRLLVVGSSNPGDLKLLCFFGQARLELERTWIAKMWLGRRKPVK
jgi:hypothetical protein